MKYYLKTGSSSRVFSPSRAQPMSPSAYPLLRLAIGLGFVPRQPASAFQLPLPPYRFSRFHGLSLYPGMSSILSALTAPFPVSPLFRVLFPVRILNHHISISAYALIRYPLKVSPTLRLSFQCRWYFTSQWFPPRHNLSQVFAVSPVTGAVGFKRSPALAD